MQIAVSAPGRQGRLGHRVPSAIIAPRDKQRLDIKEIVKRAAALNKGLFPDPIQDIGVAYYDGPLPDQDVPVLTDDYAPTDNLLHP